MKVEHGSARIIYFGKFESLYQKNEANENSMIFSKQISPHSAPMIDADSIILCSYPKVVRHVSKR